MDSDQKQHIGQYFLEKEIGRGSFATVRLAQGPAGCVAIKSVAIRKLNKKLSENLDSEIAILRGITHPHIVALTDLLRTDTHIHLVMEYCALGDLSQFIKKHAKDSPFSGIAGGLSEKIVRHFLSHIASAMAFLRSKQLIHRDLKPQNLLLSPSPHTQKAIPISSRQDESLEALPILKLADFGFAKFLPSQSLASTLCGSPLYMAPEILRGDKYDATADLWSIGAVLYEMMCGRPPFKALNHIELLRKIEKGNGVIGFPGDAPSQPPAFTNMNASAKMMAMVQSPHRSSRNTIVSPSTSPAFRYGTSAPTDHVLSHSPTTHHAHSSSFVPERTGLRRVLTSRQSSGTFFEKSTPPHSSTVIPMDLRNLVQMLLQRNPSQRMNFDEFFAHPSIAPPSTPLERSLSLSRSLRQPSVTKSVLSSSLSRKSYTISRFNVTTSHQQPISQHESVPLARQPSSSSSSLALSDLDRAEVELKSSPESSETAKPRQPSGHSSEEYVVVDKRPVQMNWLADQMKEQAQFMRRVPSQGSLSKIHTGKPLHFMNEMLPFPCGAPFDRLFPLLGATHKPMHLHVEALVKSIGTCLFRAHLVHHHANTLHYSLHAQKQQTLRETFDLYLLAMSLYQWSMDVAKMVWDQRHQLVNENLDAHALVEGVQWIRDRFNACLSLAEAIQGQTHGKEPTRRTCFYVLYDRTLAISREAAHLEVKLKQLVRKSDSDIKEVASAAEPPVVNQDMDNLRIKVLEGYTEAICYLDVILSADDNHQDDLIQLDETTRATVEKLMGKLYARVDGLRSSSFVKSMNR